MIKNEDLLEERPDPKYDREFLMLKGEF